MTSVVLTEELLEGPKRIANRLKSGYEIDFWREVKKRWLVLGVLCSVLLAVITPKIGAHGGLLHTEYTVHIPISYIYYSAGRSGVSFSHVSRRACAIGIAHAHLVAPALAISLSQAIVERDSTNRGLLTGIILSSIGGPCGWLSLSVCLRASERARAAAILVCNYVTSLAAEPLFIFVLCGRFTHPPLAPTLFSITLTTIAFCFGVYYREPFSLTHHAKSSNNHIASLSNNALSSTNHIISPSNSFTSISSAKGKSLPNAISSTYDIASSPNHLNSLPKNTAHPMSSFFDNILLSKKPTTFSTNHEISSSNHRASSLHSVSSKRVQCCALAALYMECCTRLREAEGELYVTHVLATFILVLGWLCLNALFCCVYYRSGVLTYDESYSVALCSVPKCLDVGWEFGTICVPTGLSLLPAAFLAPSQALLLAGASRSDDDQE